MKSISSLFIVGDAVTYRKGTMNISKATIVGIEIALDSITYTIEYEMLRNVVYPDDKGTYLATLSKVSPDNLSNYMPKSLEEITYWFLKDRNMPLGDKETWLKCFPNSVVKDGVELHSLFHAPSADSAV